MASVFALKEGSYSVDATKKFVPFDPEKDDFKSRPGSIFIHVNPFLVKTETDLILLDTGLGYTGEDGDLLLYKHIREAGFDPEDVSLVLMSHLHYDHSGGLVKDSSGRLEPAFPQAQHVIQRGEWETAFSDKSSSYKLPIFEALQRSADLLFVEGSGRLKPGITYELSGGHCPFHQVFLIEEGETKFFFGGDELPEPEQLIRKFIAKYDFDGRKAMELREIYGKGAAADDRTCLFYHAKRMPLGRVKMQQDAFTVIPA